MSNIPAHIDRYDILRRLGKGGMGAVYLAYDPQLGRTVAIKVLSEHSDELRARFAREARSAAALKHHNIVTIYDFGEHDGQPFLAMEYIEGETLSELIARRAPFPLSRRIELAHDLCTGLGYAHRTGIVHRDIKPANVMITTEGALKILDFGLARVVSEATQLGLTGAGMMVGTPYYMAPEQIQGKQVDQRTDIFSVGLVIYELLTGQRAFPGDSPYAVIYKVLNTEPEPIERLIPGVDPALAQLVRRASEKDPARRYQDLAVMGAELQRLRQRHQAAASDPTLIVERTNRADAAPDTTTPRSPLAGTPRVSSRDLERRRSEQIQYHIEVAQKHFAAKRYEAALEQCEAAELIEPEEPRVLEMMHRAQAALDDQRITALVDEARERLAAGALSRAEQLVGQIRDIRAGTEEADALHREITEQRADQERAAERVRAVRAATGRAAASFAAGSFEAAVRSADEALAHDEHDAEARSLKERAGAALQARRDEETRARRAAHTPRVARPTTEDAVPAVREGEVTQPAAAVSVEGARPRGSPWMVAGAAGAVLLVLLAIALSRRPEPGTATRSPAGEPAAPTASTLPKRAEPPPPVPPAREDTPDTVPAAPRPPELRPAPPDRGTARGASAPAPVTKPTAAIDRITELQALAHSPERQQRARAFDLAQSLLRRPPVDPRVARIAATLRAGAESDADRARSDAQAAGADDRWPAEWRQARDRERAARASSAPDAVRGLWEAADAYAQAAARARGAAEVVQNARAALRADPLRAAAVLETNAREYGDSPAFRDLVTTVAGVATAGTERVAREAAAAGKTSTQPFREAAEQERAGRQALGAGQVLTGVQALTRAADLYGAALRTEVPAAPAPPVALAPSPSPNAAGGAAAVAPVNALLRRMEAAYESRSTEAVKRVLPNIEFKDLVRLDSDFKEFKTIDMAITLDRLEPLGDNRFTAHCTITRTAQPKAGRPIRRSHRMAFQLKQLGDEWRVESQTPEP